MNSIKTGRIPFLSVQTLMHHFAKFICLLEKLFIVLFLCLPHSKFSCHLISLKCVPKRSIFCSSMLRISESFFPNLLRNSFFFITNRERCIIRPKAAGDSDSFRPLIPVESGHRFRSYPATFSRIPESNFIEVTLDNFKVISHHNPFKKRRPRWQERGYPCAK